MRIVTPGILIADDEPKQPPCASLVCGQSQVHSCRETENGTGAVEKAQQLQPDLVLLDLSMPLLNGAEAAVVFKCIVPHGFDS